MPLIPMSFIARDLTGKSKLSSQGDQYTFNVIDMLTNYAWYIPISMTEADKVMHTYLVNMYSKFGGSHKILSYN